MMCIYLVENSYWSCITYAKTNKKSIEMFKNHMISKWDNIEDITSRKLWESKTEHFEYIIIISE